MEKALGIVKGGHQEGGECLWAGGLLGVLVTCLASDPARSFPKSSRKLGGEGYSIGWHQESGEGRGGPEV